MESPTSLSAESAQSPDGAVVAPDAVSADGAEDDRNHQPSAAQLSIGGIAPKLAQLTDATLYGDIWARPGLGPRDRSLVTVAALVAMNATAQLEFHLDLAVRNGVTPDEVEELITHLAFYAGWPRAMSALDVARTLLSARSRQEL